VHDAVDLVVLTRRDDAARWHDLTPGAEVVAAVPNPRPARLVWERTRGAHLAREVGAELWHGPHYTLPSGLPVPSVVTVHDLTFFDAAQTHERVKVLFFRDAIRRNARAATRVLCVSRTTASRLGELVPGHAPVSVAHHGVDHALFRPTPTADDTRRLQEHGISGRYIAFVGTIQPRKGLPVLVEAFAALAARDPALRLVLAGGDGWGLESLRDAITRHGVATRVVRPGYVDDDTVAALYRSAAVVAYPSLAEGFGLPALEAMACGAPLVTTSGTAMDEFVDDAALCVPPGDAGALRDALARVLDDAAVAAQLRERGPQVAAHYTWDACTEAHVAAYRAALQDDDEGAN
jgi:glycosyltransferase involved in cell wall biosynthesis